MTSNTRTGTRILAYGETCSYTLAFNPTDAWNGHPYSRTTVGLPFGYNGTTVDTMNTTVYGGSVNPMSFSTIPNYTVSVGIPVSIDTRPYPTVANNNGAPGSAMSWWSGGTLPAGLTLGANGVISGTPTTAIADLAFQVAALYSGNASASNVFTITVKPPVTYVPPVGSPALYGSASNPTTMGSIFVEQTVTVPYVWTFNTNVQVTTNPTLQAGTAGLYVSWTDCPAPGTMVAAGSSCQANVTLTGNAASMGAFTRTLSIGCPSASALTVLTA